MQIGEQCKGCTMHLCYDDAMAMTERYSWLLEIRRIYIGD
jgi:hypothetical protein